MITFDLPQSSLLKQKLVLLLVFESPLTGGELAVAFSGQSLQPNTQVRIKHLIQKHSILLNQFYKHWFWNIYVEQCWQQKCADLTFCSCCQLSLTTSFHFQFACISEGTQYILLTAQPPEGDVEQRWRISAKTKPPDMSRIFFSLSCFMWNTLLTFPLLAEQNLKDILTGGKPGSSIRLTPLVLYSVENGTETRLVWIFMPPTSPTTHTDTPPPHTHTHIKVVCSWCHSSSSL